MNGQNLGYVLFFSCFWSLEKRQTIQTLTDELPTGLDLGLTQAFLTKIV